MTSPIVDSIRTVPLIIEKGNSRKHIPMDIDETTGFPFDREPDRDGHFRSQLDDIAKRHPEFAEHLGSFSRRRQSSGGDAEDFHRRFERPFTGHFERFGFPFDRDNFDPEQYAQQFYQQQPEHQHPQPQQSYQQQQQQPNYQHQYSYQPQPQEYQQPQQSQQQCPPQQTTTEPCASETAGRNNIQQSNTTDLGQKQEPVNERNQRSMSAPPTEKGGQRFTSSIKIPVNQPTEGEDMAQTHQADGKTTERIIPIHIEGRDEPVLPKNAPSTYSQPQQPYSAGPQPERIFGQRPEHFTQFVNREPRQYDKWHCPEFDQMHEEVPRQQRFQQQNVPPFYQQQQRPAPQQHVPPHPQPKDEIPIPVQRDGPQTKQHVPPQQAAPPQQPQPKPAPQQQKPNDPIAQIQLIQKDVSELLVQVEQFTGQPKDKQYLYLDEMLTRNLLKLDNVDTQGQETIRSARKEAIKCIEKAISVLEAKAAGNVATPKPAENMEVEDKSQETTEGEKQTEVQTMETELAPESKVEQNEPQPMEFSPESTTNQELDSSEQKQEEGKPAVENPQPVVENRAVLVIENKETPKPEDKVEPMETKEETPAVAAEEPKLETCEGQESNLPVAEAVKKFESKENEKKDESKPEENKEGAQVQQEKEKVENKNDEQKVEGETKAEDKKEEKVEEKKEKKKGKKKAEKKEK